MKKLNLAVFVSGRGTNLIAVQNAIDVNEISAEIKIVVSNKSDCAAFEFCRERGINTITVSGSSKPDSIDYETLVLRLNDLKIDLIVLAGFLKKIPDGFLNLFKLRIINIHPALLPSFGGAGMFGMNVHRAVFDKSCKVSGVTVHFVDNIYDNGKIIAQKAVDISDVNSPEEIAERVLEEEHRLLPFVIGKFAENKIKVDGNRVTIIN